MPFTLSIVDDTTAAELQFENPAPTLRDVLRERVRQEVERFNGSDSPVFRGLIPAEQTERILNGVREKPTLHWEQQFARAVASFQGNGFLVFVDDQQITDLDAPLPLTANSRVSFLKLVPLAGG